MKTSKTSTDQLSNKEADRSRIGTWVSLGVVGGVILLTYVWLYGLYMVRL